jgi:hypothetical protein
VRIGWDTSVVGRQEGDIELDESVVGREAAGDL